MAFNVDKNFRSTVQPLFWADKEGSQSANITGDGTTYNFLADYINYDQASNVTLNSGGHTIFTAPYNGFYFFEFAYYTDGYAVNHNLLQTKIIGTTASMQNYGAAWYASDTGSPGYLFGRINGTLQMSAGETAYCQLIVSGGAKVINLEAGRWYTYFAGYLIC